MKRILKRLIYLFSILILTHCSPPDYIYNLEVNGDDVTQNDDIPSNSGVVTSVSIEFLKSLYSSSSYLITDDLMIEGVITATDLFGEFPDSIIIEDDSGAIELKCDVDCMSMGFIFGATVQVYCSGLWLSATSGAFSLGGAASGQDSTSELTESQTTLHTYLSEQTTTTPQPTVVKIVNLTANHILRYVRIDNLSFSELTTFCTRNEESGDTEYTEHILTDLQGNSITLSVDANVIYADADVPSSPTSIYAIVEYMYGNYRLRITQCGYQ